MYTVGQSPIFNDIMLLLYFNRNEFHRGETNINEFALHRFEAYLGTFVDICNQFCFIQCYLRYNRK